MNASIVLLRLAATLLLAVIAGNGYPTPALADEATPVVTAPDPTAATDVVTPDPGPPDAPTSTSAATETPDEGSGLDGSGDAEPIPAEAPGTAPEHAATATATTAADEAAPAAEDRGTLVVLVTDAGGAPLPGACLFLQTASGAGRSRCDQDEEQDDGTVTIEDLASGAYTLREYVVPSGYVQPPDRPIQIVAGQTTTETIAHTPGETLVVTTLGALGQPLPGGCYQLFAEDGTPGPSACDIPDGAADGVTTIVGIVPGNYTLANLLDAGGILQPIEVAVTVVAGGPNAITVTTTSLAVTTVDPSGNPLPYACYYLFPPGGPPADPVDAACDQAGSGTAVLGGGAASLAPGAYLLFEYAAPPGYGPAAAQAVTLVQGQNAIEVVNLAASASLVVFKVDDAGIPLVGACFGIAPVNEELGGGDAACDREDDAVGGDGRITLAAAPGDYRLIEAQPPRGYAAAPEQVVLLPASGATVTVRDALAPAFGEVRVHRLDAAGAGLAGACFRLWRDRDGDTLPDGYDRRLCDAVGGDFGDGAADGFLRFPHLDPGDYVLEEETPPTGHPAADDRRLAVSGGAATEIVVADEGSSASPTAAATQTPIAPPSETATAVSATATTAAGEQTAGGVTALPNTGTGGGPSGGSTLGLAVLTLLGLALLGMAAHRRSHHVNRA